MTRDKAIEIIECGDISNRWGKDGEEVEKMAIKALEQENILDKIRAEIETDLSHFCFDEWGNENPTWKEIKAIIDKYKAESEDKNDSWGIDKRA